MASHSCPSVESLALLMTHRSHLDDMYDLHQGSPPEPETAGKYLKVLDYSNGLIDKAIEFL